MGCDIHIVAERFDSDSGAWKLVGESIANADEGWRSMPEVYEGRNYNLFAILADVRNRYDIKPIAQPRGIPDDASAEVKEWSDDYGIDGHSHSWFTVAELDAFDWDQVVNENGYVDLATYRAWKATGSVGAPSWWSGGVGGMVNVLSKEDADAIEAPSDEIVKPFPFVATDYVHISWTRKYSDFASEWLKTTMPKLREMGSPEHVRVVFFFDN